MNAPTTDQDWKSQPNKPEAAQGGSGAGWIVGVLLLALLGGGGYFAYAKYGSNQGSQSIEGYTFHTVGKMDMDIKVTAIGNIESANNQEVRCEVAGGSTILSIVQDGKFVQAGEEIVKLDTATIEDNLNTQKSAYQKAIAAKIQAEQDHQAAIIGVKEYEQGAFMQALQEAESKIKISQQNLSSAQNTLSHTETMARKGFATSLQKEADAFAVERCKLDLQAAETAKKVLVEFTKEKTMKELEAKRDSAQAKVESEIIAVNAEKVKLDRLEKQLTQCTIVAPASGMAVYANDPQRQRFGGGGSSTIEEGATVRQGQPLIRIPDLKNMQVKALVPESKVQLLQSDMVAAIAIQGRSMSGKVSFIANQPESGGWMSTGIKEYATTVTIDGTVKDLKPGMSGDVTVLVERIKDVLAVPVSAIVESNEKIGASAFYCWVKKGNTIKPVSVELGKSDEKYVVITKGLANGDQVVLNPKEALSADQLREIMGNDASKPTESQFSKDAPAPTSTGEKTPPAGGQDKSAEAGKTQQPVADNKTPEAGKAEGAGGPGGGKGGPSGAGKGGAGKKGGFRMPTFEEQIKEFDKDGDKKISRDEAAANERMSQFFDRMDSNGDGFYDKAEADAMRKMMEQFKKQQEQGGGGGFGGGGPMQ